MKHLKFKSLILLFAVVSSFACSRLDEAFPLFDCEDFNVTVIRSPDGKFEAKSYVRDCGATTATSSAVIIKRTGAPDSKSRSALYVKGQPTIIMKWVDHDTLNIKCAECEKQIERDFNFTF